MTNRFGHVSKLVLSIVVCCVTIVPLLAPGKGGKLQRSAPVGAWDGISTRKLSKEDLQALYQRVMDEETAKQEKTSKDRAKKYTGSLEKPEFSQLRKDSNYDQDGKIKKVDKGTIVDENFNLAVADPLDKLPSYRDAKGNINSDANGMPFRDSRGNPLGEDGTSFVIGDRKASGSSASRKGKHFSGDPKSINKYLSQRPAKTPDVTNSRSANDIMTQVEIRFEDLLASQDITEQQRLDLVKFQETLNFVYGLTARFHGMIDSDTALDLEIELNKIVPPSVAQSAKPSENVVPAVAEPETAIEWARALGRETAQRSKAVTVLLPSENERTSPISPTRQTATRSNMMVRTGRVGVLQPWSYPTHPLRDPSFMQGLPIAVTSVET